MPVSRKNRCNRSDISARDGMPRSEAPCWCIKVENRTKDWGVERTYKVWVMSQKNERTIERPRGRPLARGDRRRRADPPSIPTLQGRPVNTILLQGYLSETIYNRDSKNIITQKNFRVSKYLFFIFSWVCIYFVYTMYYTKRVVSFES